MGIPHYRDARMQHCPIQVPPPALRLAMCSFSAKAEGASFRLFPDVGSALIPHTEDTPDKVGEGPANHAHHSLPGCRGHLANHRTKEGGKEKMRWCFETTCQHMVRATSPSQTETRADPYENLLFCFSDSRLMRQLKSQRRTDKEARAQISQGNLLLWVSGSSFAASAVGDRSLMWVCHITGTPGCSTANAPNWHSLG